ncbi:MAG: DUF1854 domain-containing protein [Bdellovibrionota bacterium]|nr:DUF1854 domain-containing protein [Bdellovibrionota bacterium]
MKAQKNMPLTLWRQENGILCLKYGEREVEVFLKQCFPWTTPGRFLSLRDKDDNEVCLIEDLEQINNEARALLKEELAFSQFVLNIINVKNIEEDVELRRFQVETSQGLRVFQTKLEDWPEVLENGTILIEDLAGDLFRITNWRELDSHSQKELSPYVS